MNQSTHKKYLLSFNSPALEALYKKAIIVPQNRILRITLAGYLIVGLVFGGYTFFEDYDKYQLIYFVGIPLFSFVQLILLRLKPHLCSQMLMLATLVISVTMVEIFKLYRDSKFTKLTSLFYGYALYFLNSVMLINKIPWFYNTLFFLMLYLYAGVRLFVRDDFSFSVFGGPTMFIVFQTLLNYTQEQLERKSFEENERFKENLSSFKNLIKEVIPNQVFIFKMENKQMLFCNDSAESLLHFSQTNPIESHIKQNIMRSFMNQVHIKVHENSDIGLPSATPLVQEALVFSDRNREPLLMFPNESLIDLSSNRPLDAEHSSRMDYFQNNRKASDSNMRRTSILGGGENLCKIPLVVRRSQQIPGEKNSEVNVMTPLFDRSSPTTIRKKERPQSEASLNGGFVNEFITLEDLLHNVEDIWFAQRSLQEENVNPTFPKFLIFQGMMEKPNSSFGDLALNGDKQRAPDGAQRFQGGEKENIDEILPNDSDPTSARSIYFDIKVTVLEWEGEKSVLIILNDITTQHRIEELKAVDQYKDRMLATVSHDLRTPLNGLMGFIELAEERIDDKKTSKYLEFAKKSSKILLYFINDILDFSQLKSGKLRLNEEMMDVEQLMQEVVSLIKFQAKKKGIQFLYEREDPESLGQRFRVDGNRINQVLLNFLSNALKFTHQGFIKLSLSIGSSDSDPNLCKLRFSVKDTGIGIKEKDFPKLFKLFTRIEQDNAEINKTGIGLGLTISNSLARRLNYLSANEDEKGIKVQSKYGVGSEFSFFITVRRDDSIELDNEGVHDMPRQSANSKLLHSISRAKPRAKAEHHKFCASSAYKYFDDPAFRKNPEAAQVREKRLSFFSPNVTKQQRKTEDLLVLIVDDDAINLLVESNYLKRFKISFRTASNGKEAIQVVDKISQEGKKFDLILMDCNMPIMDGFRATEILKEKVKKGDLQDIPIVALTANVSPSDIQRCFASGMTHYLSKPIKKEILREKLEEILKIDLSL